MNQTFHTSAEPSPEFSEPAVSFNPSPPWGDNVPSRFTPTSQWEKDLRSTVQAAFSDVPEPQETPVSIPYSNFPVFTPSDNEEWPQKVHVRVIQPCQDYKLHSNWLQHNFPKIKTSTRNYLVHLVLKIRSFEDVGRCLSMPPNE